MQSQDNHLNWLLGLQRQAWEALLPEITLSMVFKAEEKKGDGRKVVMWVTPHL